jgi:hypothetical protein
MSKQDPSQPDEFAVKMQPMQEVLDIERSRLLQQAVEATPHHSFENALKILLAFPDLFGRGAFIEGFLLVEEPDTVLVIEHGWCEANDGAVIDPTIVLQTSPDQSVFYVAGVRRSWGETVRLMTAGKSFPAVRDDHYGADGMGHPAYRAAFLAASEKSTALARFACPPKEIVILTAQDAGHNLRESLPGVRITISPPSETEESHETDQPQSDY